MDSRVAQEETMSNLMIHFRPPRIAAVLLLLAALLHLTMPLSRLQLFSNTAIGTALVIAGFAIMIRAWWLFRQADTAVCPTEKSSHLVISGPFAWTRNPMYLGMIGMLASISVWVGTLPFFLATLVYVLVINNVFCPYEEQKMERELGESYLSYRRQVRRWL